MYILLKSDSGLDILTWIIFTAYFALSEIFLLSKCVQYFTVEVHNNLSQFIFSQSSIIRDVDYFQFIVKFIVSYKQCL